MSGEKRDALLNEAERLVLRGRKKRALAIYLRLLRDAPDDVGNLNRVGDLCVRLNRSDDAPTFYKRAAEVLINEGFYDKAIALYKKIHRIDPTRVEVLEPLADLQTRQGLVGDAVEHYEAVANYYQSQKRIDRAIGIHRKIVGLLPDDPSRRFRLASLFERKGWRDAAVAEYAAICSVLVARGRTEQAHEVCLKALEVDAGCLELVGQAVDELAAAGYAEEAEQLLEAAAQRNPEMVSLRESPEASFEEADSSVETAELPELQAEAEGAMEAAPEGDFYDLAAELENELEAEGALLLDELETAATEQSLEEVVTAMKRGVSEALSTGGCDAHFDLGIAYEQMGLYAEAITEFQLAAKDPRYLISCCSQLARCYAEQGQPELAIRWCERGLDSPSITDEQSLGLLYELADLHRVVGDAPAAEQRLEEMREIDSADEDLYGRLRALAGGSQ